LSDQQTSLLLDLEPDALIAASATMRVPSALIDTVERLQKDKGWTDKDFTTTINSSSVVKVGLIKKNILLGGYATPMEVAIDEMLDDISNVEKSAEELGLPFLPKAIYVSKTNITAEGIDNIHTPFENRLARPIAIWRHLVSKGISPSDIAVYCNLKFDQKYPAPPSLFFLAGKIPIMIVL
jgi:type III restriction enzyme